ncbi:MAG: phosphatase PAP2 family protein [Spirochaetaceae bacterium]|jgi:membrane-associated phospholipid phosphatase|nr:phosphatase PAP2 family protein [Spirochaetaceae bacterium]
MKKNHILCAAFFAALLIAASFLDLPLSMAVFSPESAAAVFLGKFGHIPGNSLFILCGLFVLFAALRLWKNPPPNSVLRPAPGAVLILGAALVTAGGVYIIFSELKNEAAIDTKISAAAAAAFLLFYGVFVFKASAKNPERFLKAGFLGAAGAVFSMAAVGALKVIWDRRRFFTMDDPVSQFTPWFLPASPGLFNASLDSDAYRSFPSGHSCAAAALVWIFILPAYFPKLIKMKKYALCAFALYLAAVMASRIILGKHFLSDTAAAAAITLFFFFAFNFLIKKYFWIVEKTLFKTK